jgi:Spy/CpxP family protein refolding chaperone
MKRRQAIKNGAIKELAKRMVSRKSIFSVFAILVLAASAHAQTATPTSTPTDRPLRDRSEIFAKRNESRRGLRGMTHRGGIAHLIRELNLTDAQREQARAIMQRRLAATKSQRQELFNLREKRIAGTFTADDEARVKTLRQEMRASMQGIREEMQGILTPEQKAKLESLQQERKTRFAERRKQRQERLNNNPQ